jgi:hypothetical protein
VCTSLITPGSSAGLEDDSILIRADDMELGLTFRRRKMEC